MIYKGTVHNGVAVHNGVSSSKCHRVGAKSIMQGFFLQWLSSSLIAYNDKYATLYSIVSLIIITESAHCSHLNIFTHLHILYYVFTVYV